MTVAGIATSPLSELEHRVQLRRAVIASTIGTTIEWYDFFLYSTVTGLVFAKLYFPGSDPLVGTLQAFGTVQKMARSGQRFQKRGGLSYRWDSRRPSRVDKSGSGRL